MIPRQITPSVRLAPLEVWHDDALAAHLDRAREHIRPWVGPSFVTEGVDGARATLHRYATSAADDGARLLGLWEGERLLGGVMYVSFSPAAGQCELGCWLEPSAEGRGLVTAACRVLLDYALGERALHRAEWRCRADNERSAAVARRLGMSLDGTLRGAWRHDGAFHDKQVWSVLRDEHLARRAPAPG